MDEAKLANDFEERHGGSPDIDAYEAIEFMREAIKPRGKVTWLTAKGVYRVDYNFNPPRVTKIEEKGNAKD